MLPQNPACYVPERRFCLWKFQYHIIVVIRVTARSGSLYKLHHPAIVADEIIWGFPLRTEYRRQECSKNETLRRSVHDYAKRRVVSLEIPSRFQLQQQNTFATLTTLDPLNLLLG